MCRRCLCSQSVQPNHYLIKSAREVSSLVWSGVDPLATVWSTICFCDWYWQSNCESDRFCFGGAQADFPTVIGVTLDREDGSTPMETDGDKGKQSGTTYYIDTNQLRVPRENMEVMSPLKNGMSECVFSIHFVMVSWCIAHHCSPSQCSSGCTEMMIKDHLLYSWWVANLYSSLSLLPQSVSNLPNWFLSKLWFFPNIKARCGSHAQSCLN